jgi:anti-sigma regulatory factor (Ser/Thr protein kinase)
MYWELIGELEIQSVPGNERQAMNDVETLVRKENFPVESLERLKTAVAEAVMNAMEHGNQYREDLPVSIQVHQSDQAFKISIVDHGGKQPIQDAEAPDIDAKLAGLQTPRGWGLFLIKNMVDDFDVKNDGEHHIIDLIFHK